MSRITRALTLGAILCACGAVGTAAAQTDTPRPNVLLIFSDDHAYQAVSCYGSRINRTPNLDRLADGGLRFDRCYVTNSICGPSRAALQTGKYAHRNGMYVNGNQFDGTQWVFPRALQQAGYQTAVIGKWHLGEHMAPQGYDYSEVLIGQGPYYNPTMLLDADGSGKQERASYTGYTTDIIADRALRWLKEDRDADRPFLLMCQHKAPHRAWMPAPRHFDLFEDVSIPEPPTLFDDYSDRPRAVRLQDMTIAHTMNDFDLKFRIYERLTDAQRAAWDAAYGPRNAAFEALDLSGQALVRWKYQRYVKDYLRCVQALDESVGRLLDYLDETGLAENTIVIYSSDQGFYLGEHGWFDKRFMYEESFRTPLLVRWPQRIAAGRVNEALVGLIDLAPTLVELAGGDVPPDVQGRSLTPWLRGEAPADWRTSFYYHYYEFPGWHSVRRHYGVTDGRYKLIHYYGHDQNEWHLVDLEADPLEVRNFYDVPEYAEARQRLERELKRLREELQVPEKDPPATFHHVAY